MDYHRDTNMLLLGLILLTSFLSLSGQHEGTFSKRIEPNTFMQYNSMVQNPTHVQYSSFGSQSSSVESNQISPEQFMRRPYTGYRNAPDDKLQEVRDLEDHQRINRFQETREYEGQQSDDKSYGIRDFDGRRSDDKFDGAREFMGRHRNDKFHGPSNFEARERNDKFQVMTDFEGRDRNDKFQSLKDIEGRERADKFHGTREFGQHRSIRYDEGFRGIPANEPGRPSRPGKPWHTSHFTEHRGRQRRPRVSGNPRRDAYKFRENLVESKRSHMPEIKRSPRIVKYIADKNGFAVREDLLKPLQDTIDRTRQESRRRIVTASAAGLAPQGSLMSQVVTSAIRVAGQSQGNGDGKFLPQIFDLSVGKRPDVEKLTYSLGAKELLL